jgi:predicted NUDIX family phosphoesterase
LSGRILTIRKEELDHHPDFNGFLGLPKEEIQRYQDSLEVHALDRNQAEGNPAYKQLFCHAAVHHNYTWLTYRQPAEGTYRSMIFSGPITGITPHPLFLDESHKSSVLRILGAHIRIPDKYILRLAGLMNDDSDNFGRSHFGLVYVLRLLQPGVHKREEGIIDITYSGNGELIMDRGQFDPLSRILIDNIPAL